MKKHFIFFGLICIAALATAAASLSGGEGAERQKSLAVSGLVAKPLNLTYGDLKHLNSVSVKVTEVRADKTYNGTFNYTGVPLKTILELAAIRKKEEGFSKPIDLAVVVRNGRGDRAVLSWGEVFYQNPSEVLVAMGSEPVLPMKSCLGCHAKGTYEKWERPLHRAVGFPKLVLSYDFYSDRCIEDISSIEVINMLPPKGGKKKKKGKLYSKRFSISMGTHRLVINNLRRYRHVQVSVKKAGEGRGFHGVGKYKGVPLLDILTAENIIPGFDFLLVFTAPDGYRSVISSGELELTPFGREIIVADALDGRAIDDEGKFVLILPHDLAADRWVKALEKIQIVQVPLDPKLYIIGVGCGDADLITLDAVSAMARADVFVCTRDIGERFSAYMGNKPVLFDPLLNLPNYYRKLHPTLSEREVREATDKLRRENLKKIKDELTKGKTVGFLEYGDPTIYGSWTFWLREGFAPKEYRVVPGISSLNAANAMIGTNVAARGSMVVTVPRGIRDNEALIKAVADKGDTLVIFVGLMELKSLMPILRKYYKQDTPVVVVYKAGYKRSGKLVKTDLSMVSGIVESEKEKFLGLIYIGEAL